MKRFVKKTLSKDISKKELKSKIYNKFLKHNNKRNSIKENEPYTLTDTLPKKIDIQMANPQTLCIQIDIAYEKTLYIICHQENVN